MRGAETIIRSTGSGPSLRIVRRTAVRPDVRPFGRRVVSPSRLSDGVAGQDDEELLLVAFLLVVLGDRVAGLDGHEVEPEGLDSE